MISRSQIFNAHSLQSNPPMPPILLIPNTPYSIRFIQPTRSISIDYTAAVDIIADAQLDILSELVTTKDAPIDQRRIWTADIVTLGLISSGQLTHSLCSLMLAAMLSLWGDRYGFATVNMEFLMATTRGPVVLGTGFLRNIPRAAAE